MEKQSASTIDIHAHIVPYCERLTSNSELINVVSNAAFVLAVVICLPIISRMVSALRAGKLPPGLSLMLPAIICLPLMIAAGSALFHASPSHLTHMLDIIPVAFFALCTVLLFIHLAGTNRARIATTMLGWIIATALAAQWPELLAHSLFYVPTAILLILLALPGNAVVDKAYLTTGDHALLSGVAVTFTMALVFRALDLTLCRLDISDGIIAEQYGTHWLWHLLTAASCALSMQLIIRMALRKSEHSYVR